jgi:ribosome-associated heat shock protein Hsp15
VNIGDVFDVKTEGRKWVIRVKGLLEKRAAYPEAIKNYEDITPPEELDVVKFQAASFQTGKRLSKVGRPTKRDLRDIRGFMGEE